MEPTSGLLEFQLEDDLAEAVAGLIADRQSGPVALARRGAEVALRLCDKHYYERPLHIWHEVGGLARALVAARPACLPLVNFANDFVRPLPEFYGRGKDEGARMRGDLRARVEAWLVALEARAARIDRQVAEQTQRGASIVSAWAVEDPFALVGRASLTSGQHLGPAAGGDPGEPRQPVYLVAGPEKLVPPGYRLPPDVEGLARLPLAECAGLLTGDDVVASAEVARLRGGLRLEPALL